MPLPSEVNTVTISDKQEFDNRGLAVPYQLWTFYIGDQGPFTEKFYGGEQDSPSIQRRIEQRVLQLRELGVIPDTSQPS